MFENQLSQIKKAAFRVGMSESQVAEMFEKGRQYAKDIRSGGKSWDDVNGEIQSWSVSNSPRRRSGGGGGSTGGAGGIIATLFIAIVLILVGLYFVANMTPMFGNITNPGGTVGTFLTLAEWMVPVIAIVALIVYGVSHLFSHNK